ncbi:MAG: T9SS type A sorting domain-containing protein [Bacteroidales bacterium]
MKIATRTDLFNDIILLEKKGNRTWLPAKRHVLNRLLFVLIPMYFMQVSAQQRDYYDPDFQRSIGYHVTEADAAQYKNIPVLNLPEDYRNKDLPVWVDNSLQPYLRPVFSQESYPNCMQSTSIAYNYTYEINRSRGIPSDVPENQYTTHFSWNFYNGGDGWYGVNYLHTFNVLEKCGNPTVTDYGGMYNGGGSRWMSGYDEYYAAMKNRITGIYAIPVDTEEGILTLKHWLNDHLDGSDVGGVASFIACSPYSLLKLPEATPEAGKYVIASWCDRALHGMTIIGYNDSIRFDYNGDGKYTNDMDINGDGEVNVRDWEIGGFKFVNSYDTTWADKGFSYVMYKTFADPIQENGIWGNQVHVINVKQNYDPTIACKVKLKHDSREMIKITAGVSGDPECPYPRKILEFPIFDFQGGDKYMQGSDTIEMNRIIEFGLDITPLLSFVETGKESRFFLTVTERDERNEGHGEILSFSLMDYSGVSPVEIPCPQNNVPLANNFKTHLGVVTSINFDKPEILTHALPGYQPGTQFSHTLQAQGGKEPYNWHLKKNYNVSMEHGAFPGFSGSLISTNSGEDTVHSIPLDFSFPYFGKAYDTLHVSDGGYIYFDEGVRFWSYIWKQRDFLKDIKSISPFLSKQLCLDPGNDDGLWYKQESDNIMFSWDGTAKDQPLDSDLQFAVQLFDDGTVVFYYGNMIFEGNIEWAGGLSDGDGINHSILDASDPGLLAKGSKIRFIPGNFPANAEINRQGELTAFIPENSGIFDLEVVLTDDHNISHSRQYQLSDGLAIDYIIHSGDDTIIEPGETVSLDVVVKNVSAGTVPDISLEMSTSDPFISITDPSEVIGKLDPGDHVTKVNAIEFHVSESAPDTYTARILSMLNSPGNSWESSMFAMIHAPELGIHEYSIVDGDNQRLDPGESATISISIQNTGHAGAGNVTASLHSIDPYVGITGNSIQEIGSVPVGDTPSADYDIEASFNAPHGHIPGLVLEIREDGLPVCRDTIELMIGKMPALVIDLDPQNHSGPVIFNTIRDMNIPCRYTRAFPVEDLNKYQSVFLSLGIHFSNHILTHDQGNLLAGFLSDGGRLYMEGRTTWGDDPQTSVHDMFNMDAISMPTMYGVLLGQDSTFTQGMAFENSATPPFAYYYLEPVAPAYAIFKNATDSLACVIAQNAGTYKTIGSITEFGALIGNDSSTYTGLMSEMLDFFDIVLTVAGMEEHEAKPFLSDVVCFPNPFREQTEIRFTLASPSEVGIQVFNLQGQLMDRILRSRRMHGGSHTVAWNISAGVNKNMPEGIYIYRIFAGDQVFTGKMVLLR